ncbi:MAG: elongation factor G [Ruminococcaceae bacterium]|jgi:elongation factor G|nr:elongation factor G [Oscillospiraceae bacterium]
MSNVKNITVVGHASKGKTTLCEAMLNVAGVTERMGKIADGNTVSDCDSEEKKRGISISSSVLQFNYKNDKINVIDTPGLFDFALGSSEGLRAADTAIVVVSARSGLAAGAEKAFKNAGKKGMARIIVTTKMDDERADFYKAFNGLVAKFGTTMCPVVVPVISGGKVAGYYNMIEDKTFSYDGIKVTGTDAVHDDEGRFDAIKEVFNEAVAGTDDELMEKYFDGEPLTKEDKIKGISIGLADGSIVPVFALSGATGEAVDQLLDFVACCAPAPKSEYATDSNDEPVELAVDPAAPLAAVCFKSIADPFIGKLNYFKVIRGTLSQGMTVVNSRTGDEERVGKLVNTLGAKQSDVKDCQAGDICAIAKLSTFKTGDTMCAQGNVVTLDRVAVPYASYSMAIVPEKKGDEEKIANAVNRLIEEDPSLTFVSNTETHQTILSGLGEQQLDVALSKMKDKYKVTANLIQPKVAYRETISKKVSTQGRHKKQSGGHGQFGDVFIEFEPCDSDELVFAERIVGGSVPKNFFPAVEKGLRESMEKGVLAGYPMVGVKATLFDGSYHPVDSSEMSFKMAASLAFKNGIPQAGPVLLEPIVTLNAICNDEAMGDVIGDINKRRGRVLGMNPTGDGMQEIIAEVPQGEMTTFSTSMRQITQGRGSFTTEFARYERCPEHITQKVIEESANEE